MRFEKFINSYLYKYLRKRVDSSGSTLGNKTFFLRDQSRPMMNFNSIKINLIKMNGIIGVLVTPLNIIWNWGCSSGSSLANQTPYRMIESHTWRILFKKIINEKLIE